MDKIKILKWIVSIIVVVSVCIITYIAYERFSEENNASKIDLMTLIPDDCDAFFYLDKFDQLKTIKQNSIIESYLKNKSNPSIIKTLNDMLPYFETDKWRNAENSLHQMIISYHTWENNQAELVLFKMASGDKERISELLDKFFKTSFTPLEETNAGIAVKHYQVSTGIKFHCFFYKGIFAGSYNNRLIDETILRFKTKNKTEADYIDIADRNDKESSLKFFIRMNDIPLFFGNNPERVDTLNLAEWVAPELSFENNDIRLNCYTSPLFENKNKLSLIIGQTAGRPLNTAVISKDCPFIIHFGLSDLDRFNQNQQNVFGKEKRDSALFRKDYLSVDSIFNKHFDSEINITYYPMMLPEKLYQKIVIIRLKDELAFADKLSELHLELDKKNAKMATDSLSSKPFPEDMITAVFGQLFEVNNEMLFCGLLNNYLIVSDRSETVKTYIKELKKGENIGDKAWYNDISNEINSKSNLFFIGDGNAFIDDRFILPFGIPRFLSENDFIFKNNLFCFQFNAEESFIYMNAVIKQLKP